MICIKADVPQAICDIDDELKAIYHSKDTVCIWTFKTGPNRNQFMDDTAASQSQIGKNISKCFIFKQTDSVGIDI